MLEVRDLVKTYHSGLFGHNSTNAVNHISFEVRDGEVFGLFGESGCGKTTTSKIIMGLMNATSGSILYNGEDLLKMKRRQWKRIRRDIQMVYQNPQMTFNPRGTMYAACAEPIRLYHLAEDREREEQMIVEMVERVGVSRDQLKKFPHEISGGQAQRISIARTLLLNPKLLICDEPTSMLDISVQAQILAILKEIHQNEKLTIIYISHDLDVMHAICDRVAVMKDGDILEMGDTHTVFFDPQQDYTKQLLSARI